MAGKESLNYRALCTDNNDEVEGLNQKLLELLKEQKVLTLASNKSQSLFNSRLANNSGTQVESDTSASPLFNRYFKDYSLILHHDSPINIPTLPTYLPPIGVFWDIENCQVSLR